MATATADILSESALVETFEAATKTRTYRVSGMSGAVGQYENEALGAVPAIGDEHESITGLYVIARRAEIDKEKPTRVNVVVEYSSLDPYAAQYEGGVSLQQETSAIDEVGDAITISPPSGVSGDDQGGEIVVDSSRATLRITRLESGISPGDVADAYINKLNSVAWNGYAVRRWKCTNVSFRSNDGGATFWMTYEFERRDPYPDGANGWSPYVVYRDENNRPHPEAEPQYFAWYDEADFNLLAL